MPTSPLGVWMTACCALLALGCEQEYARGAAGESCTSRADCESGLHCVAAVCVDADAGITASSSGGSIGDDCSSRRDCGSGLLCVANKCTAAATGTEPASARYSGRGESCAASNDCDPALACVGAMCTAVTVQLEQTPKTCHRVECEQDEDCCASFVPNENCDAYRQNCETDPVFCNTYRSLCECSQACDDELCVAAAPGCSESTECTSLQTPFCVDGNCRQCERDGNCPGDAAKCVEGVCMSACTGDEQCPLEHACEDGACVEVGCQSDRECVFLTKDPGSVCRDGDCIVPCDADSDCKSDGQPFDVCVDGRCVFVGCEQDYECRALFGLASQDANVRAVCR